MFGPYLWLGGGKVYEAWNVIWSLGRRLRFFNHVRALISRFTEFWYMPETVHAA